MFSRVGTSVLALAAVLIVAKSAPNDECIESLIVTAVTSDLPFSESDADFNVRVTFKKGLLNLWHETASYMLYDHPDHDDAQQHKGDTWYFKHSDLDTCIEPRNIESIEIVPIEIEDGSEDGWNVETAQVFAKMRNTDDIVLVAVADMVNRFILASPVYQTLPLTVDNIHSSLHNDHTCIEGILIYATTSTAMLAGSDEDISFTLGYFGLNATVMLYDRPGNDMDEGLGDIWYYDISEFFDDIQCINAMGIDLVQFNADTDYGWKVADAFVTAKFKDSDSYGLIAAGYPIEEWVDGDDGLGYVNIPLCNIF